MTGYLSNVIYIQYNILSPQNLDSALYTLCTVIMSAYFITFTIIVFNSIPCCNQYIGNCHILRIGKPPSDFTGCFSNEVGVWALAIECSSSPPSINISPVWCYDPVTSTQWQWQWSTNIIVTVKADNSIIINLLDITAIVIWTIGITIWYLKIIQL